MLVTRADIATALSTATDVTGYTKRPTTPVVGDAWPRLGGMERGPGLSFEVTWLVQVFLPQDEVAAETWLDTHYEDLVDALQPVGFVDRIDTAPISASSSEQYGLLITMRSE